MSAATLALGGAAVLLALAIGFLCGGTQRGDGARRSGASPAAARQRILFPFTARALAPRALDAALRLARAEEATLVPVFLARVPLRLPLETALPRQGELAVALQEAIEQRATDAGVPIDARIARGRSLRHALRGALEDEHYDRLVVAAAPEGAPGLHAEDIAWLLDHAAGEVVVLRPALAPTSPSPSPGPRPRPGRSETRTPIPH